MPIRIHQNTRLNLPAVFFGLLLQSFSLMTFAQQSNDVLLIQAGTLLAVPGETPLRQQTIVVRGDRIEAVESGYLDQGNYPAAEIIDLRDSFVLPGLIDMHVHLTGELGPDSRNELLYVTTAMETLRGVHYADITLRAGFTTVRDLGSESEAIYALRDAINQGLLDGPTIFAAGSANSATGSHGDVDGYRPELLELWTPETICDGP